MFTYSSWSLITGRDNGQHIWTILYLPWTGLYLSVNLWRYYTAAGLPEMTSYVSEVEYYGRSYLRLGYGTSQTTPVLVRCDT